MRSSEVESDLTHKILMQGISDMMEKLESNKLPGDLSLCLLKHIVDSLYENFVPKELKKHNQQVLKTVKGVNNEINKH